MVRRLEEIAQLAELRLGDIDRAIERVESDRRARARQPEGRRGAAPADRALEDVAAAGREPRAGARERRRSDPADRDPQEDGADVSASGRSIRAARSSCTSRSSPRTPVTTRRSRRSPSCTSARATTPGSRSSLRRTLDLEEHRVVEAMRAPASRDDAPKEWPVAKRSERLTQLRRLAMLYETRLADVDGVVYACERRARAAAPAIAMRSSAWSACSRRPAIRASSRPSSTTRRRRARPPSARSCSSGWREARGRAPGRRRRARSLGADAAGVAVGSRRARRALGAVRARSQRWPELAQVLERLDGGRPLPARRPRPRPRSARSSSSATRRSSIPHLGTAPRAIKAWHRVLELTPRNRNALDALSGCIAPPPSGASSPTSSARRSRRSFSQAGRTRRSRPRVRRGDGAREMLEEQLGAPAEAIKVLDHADARAQPEPPRGAHRAASAARGARRLRLRRCGSPSARCTCRPSRPEGRPRARDRHDLPRTGLNNPTRALQAFKRVLELDGEQEEALAASADLLARLGRWKEHVDRARAHAPAASPVATRRRPPTIAESGARSCSASPRPPPTSSAIPRARSAGGGARTTRRPTSRRSPTSVAPARLRAVARARRGAHRRAQAPRSRSATERRPRRARALRRAVARARGAARAPALGDKGRARWR